MEKGKEEDIGFMIAELRGEQVINGVCGKEWGFHRESTG